ncbi:hypothetical protein [Microbacterium sp. B19]|uniref:hypothetical protein n=1 Tax=Microbacterium sp. B19 TaxID=96765 RepID=UPI0011D1BB2F|nr:hypothetical protein [Microbacterium sp. B19]
MNEILTAAVALPTLGVAVLVWGFAPGLVNRLMARIYPTTDPRRREMIAELYTVPRWEQPFWVAQQAERALFEGIPARARDRRGRVYEPGGRWVIAFFARSVDGREAFAARSDEGEEVFVELGEGTVRWVRFKRRSDGGVRVIYTTTDGLTFEVETTAETAKQIVWSARMARVRGWWKRR